MTEGGTPPRAAEIRQWTVADIPDVQRIGWETWKAAYGAFIPEHDLRAYHDEHYSHGALEKRLRLPGTRGYMALLRGVPAGYMIMAVDDAARKCSVGSVYILPECQGCGLGTMLMEEAFRIARGARCDRLWLGVMSENLPAIAWYESLGFRFVEEAPFTMGGTTVRHYIGYRLLSPSVQEHDTAPRHEPT